MSRSFVVVVAMRRMSGHRYLDCLELQLCKRESERGMAREGKRVPIYIDSIVV